MMCSSAMVPLSKNSSISDVVALGYQFHQALVRGLGLFGQVVGNRANFGFAVATHLVGVGLHLHQVDYAGEAFLGADGQLHRNHGAAEGCW